MANISLKTMTFEGLDNIYKVPQNLDDLGGVLPTSKGGTGTNNLDALKTELDVPEIDTTLSKSGFAADAKAVGDALDDITVDVETDPTLTIANKPADAKATGDAIEALKNYVTPEMYGAVGDGIADDTEAIQSAIDAAIVGEGNVKSVYFPHIKYKITETLNVTGSGVVMFGNSGNSRYTQIIADHESITDAIVNVTKPIVAFHNLNFRSDDDSFMNVVGINYAMTAPFDCDGEVTNCYFYNMATGVKLIGKNLNVWGCNFSHCDIGVDVEVTAESANAYYRGFYVNGNRFHNCGEHSSYSNDTACIKYDQTKATVINQFFISNNYADLGCTFFRGQLQGGVISNNYIVNVHNDGIVCENASSVTYRDNATPIIINNYIATTASPNSDYGINILNGYRCIVQGNTLMSFAKSAIRVNGASGTTICNNVMFCRGSEYNINIISSAHCTVHGNVEQYTATAPEYSLRCVNSSNQPASCDYQGGKLFGDIKIVMPHETVTGVNTAACNLYKVGNMITMTLSGATAAEHTTSDTILTIPEKYRPITDMAFTSASDGARLVLYAATGILKYVGSVSGAHDLRGFLTYITAE